MRLASTAFQASLLYFALLCLLPILSVLLLVLLMLSLNIWKNKNFIRPETAQKKSELQMRIEHTSLERALARMFQPLSSRRFNGEYRNLIITTLVIGVFFFIFTISESVFLNPGPNSICFSTAHSRWANARWQRIWKEKLSERDTKCREEKETRSLKKMF